MDAESDRWRAAAEEARARLAALEAELRRESGIEQLRVAYHRTFGYQIELPRSQSSRAPERWERRQSLRDRERFTEPRLRAIELELEDAEQQLAEAERHCTERLREALVAEAEAVRRNRGGAGAARCGLRPGRGRRRAGLDEARRRAFGRTRDSRAAAIRWLRRPRPRADSYPTICGSPTTACARPSCCWSRAPTWAGKSTYLRQAAAWS